MVLTWILLQQEEDNGRTNKSDVDVFVRTPRPNFDESLVYYLDEQLRQIETAITNLKEAIKTAEDRLTAGGL